VRGGMRLSERRKEGEWRAEQYKKLVNKKILKKCDNNYSLALWIA